MLGGGCFFRGDNGCSQPASGARCDVPPEMIVGIAGWDRCCQDIVPGAAAWAVAGFRKDTAKGWLITCFAVATGQRHRVRRLHLVAWHSGGLPGVSESKAWRRVLGAQCLGVLPSGRDGSFIWTYVSMIGSTEAVIQLNFTRYANAHCPYVLGAFALSAELASAEVVDICLFPLPVASVTSVAEISCL